MHKHVIINDICDDAISSLTNDIETDTDNSLLEIKEYSIVDELRHWAVECNIKHNHLDKLLSILRKNLITDLPKSSRTFLNTSEATYNIVNMEDNNSIYPNGQFVYFGIETGLKLQINKDFRQNVIQLLINVDGMPISASGSKSFWPILGKIHYYPDIYKPFTIAIYYGQNKPKYLNRYLESFIAEINSLQQHGICIENRTYKVQLLAFISDTPARAFLKCTKGHNGYNACERCTITGELIRIGKCSKLIYPGLEYPERTKLSFFLQEDRAHHTGVSPLINIIPEIDFTKVFVLDHMHLFFNGIMKKLIDLWMKGPLATRISRRLKVQLSERLLHFAAQIPTEFQRKPRTIFEYLNWKATEFRFFLLYCGPIVLKDILSKKLYDHFMLLHVACRILCSEELAVIHNTMAKNFLKKFVLAMPYLYGPQSQVMNVHNLLHVADDVLNFNCSLSRISCFPFENTLGEIKRVLRTANKPLAQVCRRLHEQNMTIDKNIRIIENKILKSIVHNNKICIQKVKWNRFIITTKRQNNMVLLNNGIIMEISSMYSDEHDTSLSSIMIEGKIWTKAKLLYKYPCKSSLLNMWHLAAISRHVATYPLTYVSDKLIRLELPSCKLRKQNTFVISFLH